MELKNKAQYCSSSHGHLWVSPNARKPIAMFKISAPTQEHTVSPDAMLANHVWWWCLSQFQFPFMPSAVTLTCKVSIPMTFNNGHEIAFNTKSAVLSWSLFAIQKDIQRS